MKQKSPWLNRWLPLIEQHVGKRPILEIGCGDGQDTAVLLENGLSVVAMAISQERVEQAAKNAPQATFSCQDMRKPLPHEADGYGVVLASLSLHYFSWEETAALVQRLWRLLQPQGLLLCRLNSTNDVNFGAVGYPEIDTNFYRVNGRTKRFFDQRAIELLFHRDWKMIAVEEMTIARYGRPKVVWEVILRTKAKD